MYHRVKREALMCGCGFGDIFANRFRKHLLEVHELRMTISDVAEQFFWHDLPPFQQVWKWPVMESSWFIDQPRCRLIQ